MRKRNTNTSVAEETRPPNEGISAYKLENYKAAREFLLSYQQWLKNGAPERNNEGFTREYGLCRNARRKYYALNFVFEDKGVSTGYPFGGEMLYEILQKFRLQHLNPFRRYWVRKFLKETKHLS